MGCIYCLKGVCTSVLAPGEGRNCPFPDRRCDFSMTDQTRQAQNRKLTEWLK